MKQVCFIFLTMCLCVRKLLKILGQKSLSSSDPCPRMTGWEERSRKEHLTSWGVFRFNSCLPCILNPSYPNIYSSCSDTFLLPSATVWFYFFIPLHFSKLSSKFLSNKNHICYGWENKDEKIRLCSIQVPSHALYVFFHLTHQLYNCGISKTCWTTLWNLETSP